MNREYLENKIEISKKKIESDNHILYNIYPVLVSWAGKQVNKRLVTAIQNYIGSEYTIYLINEKWCDRIELRVRRGNDNLTLWVATKDNRKFDLNEFRIKNDWVLSREVAYKHYVEAKDHIDEWVDEYQKIQDDIKKLKNKLDKHGCSYMIDWKELSY